LREARLVSEVVALAVHEYRTRWKGVEDPGFMYARSNSKHRGAWWTIGRSSMTSWARFTAP
jgi:hypothetical protein